MGIPRRWTKEQEAWRRSQGMVKRKATLDERADKLVLFSDVMLRRKLHINDAKCLLQNWEPYGPDFEWWFPPKPIGGEKMAKKAKKTAKVRKVAKAAKTVPKRKQARGR